MGKKKFKKNNKKAEQQMESAERISRLMEMYDSGEISDTEFIELMNSKDAAEETVRDTDIRNIISDALGFPTVSSPLVATPKSNDHDYGEGDDTTSNPLFGIGGLTYAEENTTDERVDITEIEARVIAEEMRANTVSDTEESTNNDHEPFYMKDCGRKATIIPGVSDFNPAIDADIPDMSGNVTEYNGIELDDEPEDLQEFSGDEYAELRGDMPELALVDTDVDTVMILSRFRGFRVMLDLYGGNDSVKFNPCNIGLSNEQFYEYIRIALLMIIGDNDTTTTTDEDLNSMLSSVTALNTATFKMFTIQYPNINMGTWYILYTWTIAMENEFQQLIEWLDEENLTKEFTLGLLDLVTNPVMFPLLEEPKRSKYITMSDNDDIKSYVDAVNSDNSTEFGIVNDISEFNRNCTMGSLDSMLSEFFKLREAILGDDSSNECNDIDMKKVSNADEQTYVAKEISSEVITASTETTVTMETTTVVSDEIEVDDVSDTSEISLTTEDANTEDEPSDKFVIKPIVK